MYFTANGRALPCCIAPFSQRGYENYTLGDATQDELAGDLERSGLPGVSRCAALGCAAEVLRQLRPALEPLRCRDDGTARRRNVSAIIPCLDEEDAIGSCVAAVLAHGVGEVIVVDGQSTDRTAERAAAAGAKVVIEPARGYGQAMLSGLAALSPTSTIVLFIDGDGSDRPDLIPAVLEPIESGRADFVLGSRLRGERERGSLGASQIVAGHLAGLLIRLLYGVRFTDMSPFRAIRRDVLEHLGMAETTFGWNLEMQMRVAAAGLRVDRGSRRPAPPRGRGFEGVRRLAQCGARSLASLCSRSCAWPGSFGGRVEGTSSRELRRDADGSDAATHETLICG